jgi:hypothetical protein
MDIATRLDKAIAAYTGKTGQDVWCIYLGRSQMRELLAWAETNACYIAGPDLEGKNRPEYCGALAFEVNDDDHLNVS